MDIQSAYSTPSPQYTKTFYKNGSPIHFLEFDPKVFSLALIQADSKKFTREYVSKIALKNKALAAINAGFFKMGEYVDGLPAGVLKVDNKWLGLAYKPRVALGWSSEKKPSIDIIQTHSQLKIENTLQKVQSLNRNLTASFAVFTNECRNHLIEKGHESLTRIYIENRKVINIQNTAEVMPQHFDILYQVHNETFKKKPFYTDMYAAWDVRTTSTYTTNNWSDYEYIVGGAGLLVVNGRTHKDFSKESMLDKFIEHAHARTAIGLLENGNILWVIVESQPFSHANGVSLYELAEIMAKAKCISAMNLDGGGSSTLYYNNRIVNNGYGDEDEDWGISTTRKVANILAIRHK